MTSLEFFLIALVSATYGFGGYALGGYFTRRREALRLGHERWLKARAARQDASDKAFSDFLNDIRGSKEPARVLAVYKERMAQVYRDYQAESEEVVK